MSDTEEAPAPEQEEEEFEVENILDKRKRQGRVMNIQAKFWVL